MLSPPAHPCQVAHIKNGRYGARQRFQFCLIGQRRGRGAEAGLGEEWRQQGQWLRHDVVIIARSSSSSSNSSYPHSSLLCLPPSGWHAATLKICPAALLKEISVSCGSCKHSRGLVAEQRHKASRFDHVSYTQWAAACPKVASGKSFMVHNSQQSTPEAGWEA